MMEFEVRHWMTQRRGHVRERGNNAIGDLFYGSKGYLAVDSYTSYKTWMGQEQTPGPAGKAGGDHYLNFIEAVQSRKREHLNAEIEEGAISTTLVHLANISYRLGRTLNFDAATYSVKGDPEANKMFTRDTARAFGSRRKFNPALLRGARLKAAARPLRNGTAEPASSAKSGALFMCMLNVR